jgi:cell division control protein 6
LIGSIPTRGLSNQDFLEILIEYLKENKCYLILVLDELGSLMKKDSDLIYTLSRINELKSSDLSYISLIGVVKDLLSLRNLDEATISSLQNEVIRFKKYTENQIFEIIYERVVTGLKPGIIDDTVIRTIASLTSVSGDMRRALKIIRNAVRYAEYHDQVHITDEIIQNINSEFVPFGLTELGRIKKQALYLYKAVCNLLTSPGSKATITEIKEEYINVCKEYSTKPRSDTQIWEYIQILKQNDLITTVFQNRNQRGRQSSISIPNYPVKPVLKGIEQILRHGE